MIADMESEKELMNKAKRPVDFRLCRVSGYYSNLFFLLYIYMKFVRLGFDL